MKKLFSIIVSFVFYNSLFAQNNALCFDGINDLAMFPNTPAKVNNLQNYTIETYVYFNGAVSNQPIYSKDQGTNKTTLTFGYSVTATGATATATPGKLYYRASLTSAVLESPFASYVASNWFHIAITYDGGTLKLYTNGALTTTLATTAASLMANSTATNTAYFGFYGGKYFNGKLDNFRIWNYARTQTQITNYKNCEMIGNESGLLVNYNFNQTGSVVVNDNVSPNLNSLLNGTFNGTASSGWVTSTASNLTPTVTISGLPTNGICPNTTATISASGSSTYLWSTSETTNVIAISPTTTITYSVIGTNGANSCYNQAIKTITIHPTPNIGLSTGSPNPDCEGNVRYITYTSSSSPNSASNWTLYPGGLTATGQNSGEGFLYPATSTIYTVSASNTLGCISTKTIALGVSICTGIEGFQSISDIKVYPNPATSILNADLPFKSTSIKLYDITGKQIIETTAFPINTSWLENGIYFIEIQSENEMIKKKIIISK
ncbi:MAG TPA: T9SS type A sorting domain-containing protein [Bacteroidia bacterium]|nr:T9SS type A sorting domain-containing protein [Bacteroidia bacterium]